MPLGDCQTRLFYSVFVKIEVLVELAGGRAEEAAFELFRFLFSDFDCSRARVCGEGSSHSRGAVFARTGTCDFKSEYHRFPFTAGDAKGIACAAGQAELAVDRHLRRPKTRCAVATRARADVNGASDGDCAFDVRP